VASARPGTAAARHGAPVLRGSRRRKAALNVDTANATGALRLYEHTGFALKDTYAIWTRPLS